MKRYEKKDFPVAEIRRFLEPGPVVLVSSAWKGKTNIMTMGWHTVMEFTPSLVGCIISSANHSFEMIRRSRECVINVPTVDLAKAVVRVGNNSGRDLDKFAAFGLTAVPGTRLKAPLVRECYASFECKLVFGRVDLLDAAGGGRKVQDVLLSVGTLDVSISSCFLFQDGVKFWMGADQGK